MSAGRIPQIRPAAFWPWLALPIGSSGVDGLGVQTNGEEAEQQAGECADEV